MADKTIHEQTAAVGVTSAHEVPVWNPVTALSYRVTVAQLLASVGPATSTFSALGVAQTYTALKRFNAGLTFDGTDILDHFSETLWSATAEIADAATAGTVAGSTIEDARYVRIGPVVILSFRFTAVTTAGMTGGNSLFIRGLPFPILNSANYRAYGQVNLANVTFAGVPQLIGTPATSYFNINENISGAGAGTITVSDLTSGSANVAGNIVYRTD